MQLAKAFKLYQQYMGEGAYPIWIDRSERVEFEAKKFVSKSEAAVARAREADIDKNTGQSTAAKGTQYFAVPHTLDGGPMPTLREWLEEKEKIKQEREKVNPNIALKRPLDPFGNPQ